MGGWFGGANGAAVSSGVLAMCKNAFDRFDSCHRPGTGGQAGRWPDDQDRRAIELRVGATAPFLQMLHSTTSTVGTGGQESLA